MRIAIIILIVLVLGGLAWVTTETWNRGAEGIDVLGSESVQSASAEDSASTAGDASSPKERGREGPANLSPVRGRIIGPDGGPVVGARVSLIRLLSAWPEMAHDVVESGVYSDADGQFLFQTPRGDDLMIDVFQQDLASRRVPAPKEVSSLTIAMEHGFEVKGRIRQNNRSVVVLLEPRSGGYSRAVKTSVDSRGFFSFKNVPAGLVRISARHEVFTISMPSVTVGSEERWVMGLSPGSNKMVRGNVHVAGSLDEPVSGAEVRIYPSTAWDSGLLEPLLASTDEKGRFYVRGLTEGNLRIEIHHPDYATSVRIVPRGRRNAPLIFEMLAKSRIHGRLRGADLTGVRISLVSSVGEIGWATVAVDGSFEFSDPVSNGRAILEIEDGVWAFAESSSRYLDISVREDDDTSLDLAVATASVLSGRVVDSEGEPLAGVQVSTPRRRVVLRSPERLVTVTDEDGRYQLRGLVVGTVEVFLGSVELLFERDGYAPNYVAVTGSSDQGEVVLVRPGIIHGTVTRGGVSLPGAIVFAGQGNRTKTTVVTGPDGKYRLGSLPPGSYRVKVRYSTLPLQVANQLAEVQSGDVSGPIDIDFPKGKIVQGTVRDSFQVPVPEASVQAIGAFESRIITRTDQTGSFVLEVPEGAKELEVVSPDLQIVVREEIIESPGEEVLDQGTIRLPMVPRASLSLRVSGLPSRRPLTSGVLRIEPLDAADDWDENTRRQRRVPARWVEMPNGELQLDDFPAGKSRIVLQCPGFSPYVQEVELKRSEVKLLPAVALEPGARMRGLVTNSAGVPVAGAVVHLGEELDLFQPDARMTYRTDSRGEFEIGGVTPAGKRLVIYAEGYATVVIDLEYPKDLMRSDPRSIILQPATSIFVHVKNAEGRPQNSGWVVLLKDGVRLDIEEPNEDGVVSFLARGAGSYRVSLLGRESEGREVVVTVDSNELEVDLLVGGN